MQIKKLVTVFCMAAAVAAASGCSRDSEPRVSTDGSTVDFASMDDYKKAEVPKTRDQVVFIGLDGASWGIIDPMIEAGKLPTFARLKREGAFGTLRSVDCFFSPPAWVSMYTGYKPEHHGVYTFGTWHPDLKEFRSVSSLDVHTPAVWDIASSAGKRVAVTNMAVTHPVHEINGIMVAGLMAPFGFVKKPPVLDVMFHRSAGGLDATLDAKSLSPPLYGEVQLTVSTLALCMYDLRRDGRAYDTIALKVFPSGEDWKRTDDVPMITFRPGEYSPWFQIMFKREGDDAPTKTSLSVKVLHSGQSGGRGQLYRTPMLRAPSDPDLQLTYPADLGQEIEDKFGYYLIAMSFPNEIIPSCAEATTHFASWFYDYDDWDLFFYTFMAPDNIQHREGFSKRAEEVYETIDGFLADLIDKLPEDATLVIASDHGFARYDYVIDLNFWLYELGLFETPPRPNYERSLVFHDQWCLYFNHDLLTKEELLRRGVPVPPNTSPRDALIAYLQEQGKTLEDRKMGTVTMGRDDRSRHKPQFSVEFVPIPEDAVGLHPDMVVIGAYDNYYVEGDDIGIKSGMVVRQARPRTQWYHQRDGIYMLWGKNVVAGTDGGVRDIEDIAPTILRIMDLPLARDFDGRPIDSVFDPDYIAAKQTYYLDDYASYTPEIASPEKDLETLEDKLRALGYVR